MRYIYLRKGENGRHNGVICFGYTVSRETRAISYTMAFCSPKDNFSKKLAHLILQGRFRKGKCRTLIRDDARILNGRGIFRVIVDDFKTNPNVEQFGFRLPRWAKKLEMAA